MVMTTTLCASSPWRHHYCFTYSNSKSFHSDSLQQLIFPRKFDPHRPSFLVRLRSNSKTRSPRCLSAGPGPPDADPPPPPEFAGKLSKFQDQVRIFFAVLFWVSLFFWSSAWDGGNSGRPDKGSRFRR
ncbi:hypothetical protein ERO13_D05G127100v2 [Gossypium hirsutum]|uniref:Uncharacterized protein n=5 Tax=Gossypium TaxID=3633 RepID=A0A5J5RJM8_GOSBA|nr:uncharacterized protein LOC107906492 [Gossypium hirsutum]KAB2028930.1 hypothetical protein ES319_D05G129800v1 [Gossypium barbadense]TYG68206.1 hypothetical protein ES288_D05G135700v1 [Gossypium darwinii]TYH70736.1 hypothetical protein ES332_D05G137100v1 [Gossypium tomentosum]TYI81153.1 hypothetical protein E1A91_D05G135400v1 [Gossypium mustelinum]KAB2028931.1 hypothetical protein ES319_D05G129800v1 [Gossypium barbadense]